MTDSRDLLDWLQSWYAGQCDGDWEHEWGVRIATLDNPGWTIEIDLAETDLEGHPYPLRVIDRGPQDEESAWGGRVRFLHPGRFVPGSRSAPDIGARCRPERHAVGRAA